ncbi:MAG TPA: hypothetical protein VGS01_04455 [Candidatus Limnocylindria bacterium]|jgi:hypothetical protein|nr:hypothetical protein [Candidatus Limnocylindria bacterium]
MTVRMRRRSSGRLSFGKAVALALIGTAPRTTPQSNVQLVFDQVDGRWYWVGALFNAVR